MAQVGGRLGVGQNDYTGLSTSIVWRSVRSHAAAKLEALSSNDRDEIEIAAIRRFGSGVRPASPSHAGWRQRF